MKQSLILCIALLCGRMALAESSVFSPDQLAKLQSIHLKIVVPAYVPAGFRVSNVYVAWEDTPDVSYAILYEGSKQGCFIIEAAGGGIGDMTMQKATGDFIRPTMRIKKCRVWHGIGLERS